MTSRVLACIVVLALGSIRPASAQEVWLTSRGVKLAAVLQLPPSRGPHPAVVMVHGSGRLTATDMLSTGSRLVAMGFAVLAYDKRGVGRSEGEYSGVGIANSEAMFDLLAADALAGVEYLETRPEVDATRIGLFGISQGGWIAPLAASRNKSVAFVVSVSGPAVSVGEEIAYSNLAGEDPGSVQGLSDAEIAKRLESSRGPRGYNPEPVLANLTIPTFWVFGERDRSIPLAASIATLNRIKRVKDRPIALVVIPGVNHGFRKPTGEMSDIWRPIREWLVANRFTQ
jgi:dipeptidyl aminopeptidase/acylaminoacyl peptidase